MKRFYKLMKRFCKKLVQYSNLFHSKSQIEQVTTNCKPNLLEKSIIERGIINYLSFDFMAIKQRTLEYLDSLHIRTEKNCEYKYTLNGTASNIYNSVYACMLLSLYGEIPNLSETDKKNWVEYFNSFQDAESGLFFDPSIRNEYYDDSDWWGARHLIPHIIYAYSALNAKPLYEFKWVSKYYNKEKIFELINSCKWDSAITDETDIDNKIMNIGVTLQYQRDYWQDNNAREAFAYLKDLLIERINPESGLWGKYDIGNSYELPRMIQFAYHILRIFIYDKEHISNAEKIIDLTLMSQNRYGGFGEKLNSSACEDIDAIDILIYLSKQTDYRKTDINNAVRRGLIFILSNQNEDGGFVFRRDEALWYGHDIMCSDSNISALFPTWFRTLCIANICDYLNIGEYTILRVPGFSK